MVGKRWLNVFTVALMSLAWSVAKSSADDHARPQIKSMRVPNGGIQPQVMTTDDGVVHLLYYQGEAGAGNIFYVRSTDAGATFTRPIRVNSQDDSAIAAGTIRGAQMALGSHGRVHVAWNGSGAAEPKGLANPELPEDSPYRYSSPMLYSRMNDEGSGFEPQRNLMTHTYALDGGGSVAADSKGHVYVVWHAITVDTNVRGEAARSVWIARSQDDGKTFTPEVRANQTPTGACGCCGLKAQCDSRGNVLILYRAANDIIHRDMYALISTDQGMGFQSVKLDDWKIGSCVMSSASILCTPAGTWAAWETEQQVKFMQLDDTLPLTHDRVAPPPSKVSRKHPTMATNQVGQTILVWTEGTGWGKGGAIAWNVFDQAGNEVPGGSGREDGLPVWSLAAAFARPDGSFAIIY